MGLEYREQTGILTLHLLNPGAGPARRAASGFRTHSRCCDLTEQILQRRAGRGGSDHDHGARRSHPGPDSPDEGGRVAMRVGDDRDDPTPHDRGQEHGIDGAVRASRICLSKRHPRCRHRKPPDPVFRARSQP